MSLSRIVEYVFFFSLLVLSGYMVWLITAPFLSALALAAVIVTISSPLYYWLLPRMPKRAQKSLAAFCSTIIVFIIGILPILLITTLIVSEVASFYRTVELSGEITLGGTVTAVETQIQTIVPGFEINLSQQLGQIVEWFTGNLANIFASTVTLIFLLFISLIASFYFFRDGHDLLQLVIKASPLPDHEDKEILDRLARAVRGVATGTLLVAVIQGVLAAVGLSIVGIDRAILLGSVAAIGAMIPGVGTTIVMVPVILYLFLTGQFVTAFLLAGWAALVVGTVDNILGPHLMSRGNHMHPFIILISVLGGLSLFGPIGFLVGPVVVTLFLVLLEIYNQYIVQEQRIADLTKEYDQPNSN